jgi:hypothetical protein
MVVDIFFIIVNNGRCPSDGVYIPRTCVILVGGLALFMSNITHLRINGLPVKSSPVIISRLVCRRCCTVLPGIYD